MSKFGRDIDILVKSDSGEVWYEQKNWKGKKPGTSKLVVPITPWKWGSGGREVDSRAEFDEKSQGNYAHRQFVIDHIARQLGSVGRDETITEDGSSIVGVDDFEWHFFKFKRKLKGGVVQAQNPSKRNLQEDFKKVPSGVSKQLLQGHTGRSTVLDTSKINLGVLDALLNQFDADLITEIINDQGSINISNQ